MQNAESTTTDHRECTKRDETGFSFKKSNLFLLVFLGIIAFFLFTEHRAHLFGVLPYLLLLACPLMHLFHGGHGGHHGGHEAEGPDSSQQGGR